MVVLGGFVGLGGLIFVALRHRPLAESQLYADAMRMVAELREQRAELQARVEILERELETARDHNEKLERQVGQLYTRLEQVEARMGRRREDDQ